MSDALSEEDETRNEPGQANKSRRVRCGDGESCVRLAGPGSRYQQRGLFDLQDDRRLVRTRKARLSVRRRQSRFRAGPAPGPNAEFEPLTLHAALATQTSRVGLVATASTTYSAPFHVARVFASLDKLSGGRAGWNMVTTGMSEAAGNFGSAGPVDHATRYKSATEFVEVVQGLWDSWEEGAITTNAETGRIFRQDKSAFARPRRQILFGAWAAQCDTHATGPTGTCAGGELLMTAKSLRHDSRR